MSDEENTQPSVDQPKTTEPDAPATQDPAVYNRKITAGSDADVPDGDSITLDVNVSVWEVQSADSISIRTQRMEQSEVQVRTTLEQLEANNQKGSEDYVKLDAQRNEIIRQMEHTRKTLSPGDIILLGKVKGTSQVTIGKHWNQCLDRHVIIDNGVVVRVLWKAPL